MNKKLKDIWDTVKEYIFSSKTKLQFENIGLNMSKKDIS